MIRMVIQMIQNFSIDVTHLQSLARAVLVINRYESSYWIGRCACTNGSMRVPIPNLFIQPGGLIQHTARLAGNAGMSCQFGFVDTQQTGWE